jgi:hypothetical protein
MRSYFIDKFGGFDGIVMRVALPVSDVDRAETFYEKDRFAKALSLWRSPATPTSFYADQQATGPYR